MFRTVILLLTIGVLGCRGDCNVCSSPANVACISATQFQFCQNNTLLEPVNVCPNGTYCTGDASVCQPDYNLRACDSCEKCSDDGNFACLGVRTFALCLGTGNPSNITGSCAPDHVCNRDNPRICGLATEGFQATCPLIDDENNATPFPPDVTPNVFCRSLQRAGRFPYFIDTIPSCTMYVRCFTNNSIWYGATYICPGSTYFQSTSAICNSTLPAYCTSVVVNLQLQNLRLL